MGRWVVMSLTVRLTCGGISYQSSPYFGCRNSRPASCSKPRDAPNQYELCGNLVYGACWRARFMRRGEVEWLVAGAFGFGAGGDFADASGKDKKVPKQQSCTLGLGDRRTVSTRCSSG